MGVLVWSPLAAAGSPAATGGRASTESPDARAARGKRTRAVLSRAQFDRVAPEIQRKLDLVEQLAKSPPTPASR